MPAISLSHIRASRQSASMDPVGFWRGIKFTSLSVRIPAGRVGILELHRQFKNASAIKCILKLGGEYSTKSLDYADGAHPINHKRPKKLSGLLQTCNGAPSQTSKSSHDEDATTGRDAASHGRALWWGAMGQERQWPLSTGGSRHPLEHTGTHGPMAHRRGRAKPYFNRLFREQLPGIRNGEDPKTGHDAASEGRTLRWGAMGQEGQWPLSTGGSRRPLAHTGTRGPMAHRRGRAKHVSTLLSWIAVMATCTTQ